MFLGEWIPDTGAINNSDGQVALDCRIIFQVVATSPRTVFKVRQVVL